MLQRNIEEHVELTLASLPTAFSQLAFLASVRDTCTGRYLHEGWYGIASPEEVHGLLQRTHRRTFHSVLGLRLPEMCGELKSYLRSVSQASAAHGTARVWLELESYREMIPQGCSFLDRDLFVSQMRAALRVLALAPELPLPREQCALQSPQLVRQFQRHRDN